MSLHFITRIGPGFHVRSTFEAMNFPAGEAHVKVAENQTNTPHTQIAHITGCDPNELMTLAMWADACKRRGDTTVLLMPYLPGARADRGVPFGAAVYANLINSMELDEIVTLDPHSPVMPSLLNNLTVIDSAELIAGRFKELALTGHTGVIAPDAGAVERAGRVAAALERPLFRAEKHRDFDTSRLSGFTCEPLNPNGKYLVVDDICDGGGTFMGLADAIDLPRERLTLWVSHGVFSGRAEQLFERFGNIVTTDSHPGHQRLADLGAIIYPLRSHLLGHITVNQFTAAPKELAHV